MIQFTIPGRPLAVQSARFASGKDGKKGHSYQKKEVKNWVAYVSMLAAQVRPEKLFDGPLCVDIRAYFAVPKSRKKMAGQRYVQTPDREQICKGICDAMEDIIYVNDKQICAGVIEKWYCAEYGQGSYTNVMIEPLET